MSSEQAHPLPGAVAVPHAARAVRRKAHAERLRISLAQLAILIACLGLWEGLTRIPWFQQNTIFDPFFISRPSLVGGTGFTSGYWHVTRTTRMRRAKSAAQALAAALRSASADTSITTQST